MCPVYLGLGLGLVFWVLLVVCDCFACVFSIVFVIDGIFICVVV